MYNNKLPFRNEAASTFSSQTTLSIEGQQSTNTTAGQVGQESNADSGCLVLNRNTSDLDSSVVLSGDFHKAAKLKTTHNLTDQDCLKNTLFQLPITFFPLVYFKALHVTFNTVGSQSTLVLYTQHLSMVGFVSIVFFSQAVKLL